MPDKKWTIRSVRDGAPQYVPDGEPPVYFPVVLEVDGPWSWSLEPGDVLVPETLLEEEREARKQAEAILAADPEDRFNAAYRTAEQYKREKEAAQEQGERFGMERNEAREQVRKLEAALLETRKALRAYHEVHDPECRLDHHGLCQEHYLHPADECPAKLAKAALEAYEGNPDA